MPVAARRQRLTTMILAGALLQGCGLADPGGSTLPIASPIRLDTREIWAGGSVTLTSATFRSWGDSVMLQVGQGTLRPRRLDDTTLQVAIPDTLGGSYSLAVSGPGVALPAGNLTVYGFVSSAVSPWYFGSSMRIWPRGPQPGVIGYASESGAEVFVMIDLATMTATPVPELAVPEPAARGPGPTTDDSVFVFYNAQGLVESWRLGAEPARLQQYQAFPDFQPMGQAALLAPSVWYQHARYSGFVFDGRDPRTTLPVATITQPNRLLMSPRHDRLVAVGGTGISGSGIPVMDVAQGTMAYNTGFYRLSDAAFSHDGEWLYTIYGSKTKQSTSIRILSAATGQVAWDTTTTMNLYAVTPDDDRNLLFVVGQEAAGGSPRSVVVINLVTHQVIGRMSPPAAVRQCGRDDCFLGLLATGAGNALYYVAGPYRTEAVTRVYRFLLPEPVQPPIP